MWNEASHRILLRGPWQCEWLDGPVPALDEARTRLHMPVSWQDAFGAVSGRVRFSRRFHLPTNLEPEERVVLAFAAVGGSAQFTVNETDIDPDRQPDGMLRCDVTDLLKPANMLTVDVEFDPQAVDEPGGLWKPVAIEIHWAGPRSS